MRKVADMGYEVSIELKSVEERAAYDASTERLGIDHEICTWGDAEPSEWQIKNLWAGGSIMRDLAEFLSADGKRIGDEAPGYCPTFAIRASKLVSLGEITEELWEALPDKMEMLTFLGCVNEDDACELWGMLERGVMERSTHYLSIPTIKGISVPGMSVTLTHDDKGAPIPRGNKDAYDLQLECLLAEHAVRDAEGAKKGGDAESEAAIEELRARLDEARKRLDAVRPIQDTVTIPGGRIELSSYDEGISVDTEKCDPMKGFMFKTQVVKAIESAFPNEYDIAQIRDIIASNPGVMLMTLGRLGDIGRVAEDAGIAELVLSPSW